MNENWRYYILEVYHSLLVNLEIEKNKNSDIDIFADLAKIDTIETPVSTIVGQPPTGFVKKQHHIAESGRPERIVPNESALGRGIGNAKEPRQMQQVYGVRH